MGRAAPARHRGSGLLIGLLVGLLGFGIAVQFRPGPADSQLAAARPEDLVRILGDLDSRKERLREEIATMEETKRQLASSAGNRETALAQARQRADELEILAGTKPAEGPGLEIRVESGADRIRADAILNAVEELRGAGAEALQIGGGTGTTVRIVAGTYFVDATDGLEVDGQVLPAPYTITVIGDPETMQTALNIPGGVVDAVKQRGGNVIVHKPGVVRVSALRQLVIPRYARPAS